MKNHYRLELVKIAKSGEFSWIEFNQIFLLHDNEAQRLIRVIKEALKDTGRLYIIVIILLVLGAIWEMTGLYLLMP